MTGWQVNFLVGPTAVGKTAVAHLLARTRGAAVLSADSMLVYRGMDIGTAKPTASERAQIGYWGLDLVAPTVEFSAAAYLSAALEAVAANRAAQRELIVTGGTGLYVKALMEGFDRTTEPDPVARARWEALWRAQGIGALQQALRERSPAHWASLADPRNPRRLIRALERTAPGVIPQASTWNGARARHRIAGLCMPVAQLHRRIRQRVERMFAAGLLEEVRGLMDRGVRFSATAAQAIGYAEAIAHWEGGLSQEEAMTRIEIRTRQLAKRQMTWFRHQANVVWIEVDEGLSTEAIAGRVAETWAAIGPVPLAIDEVVAG